MSISEIGRAANDFRLALENSDFLDGRLPLPEKFREGEFNVLPSFEHMVVDLC